MDHLQTKTSRKKFIIWGIGLLSAFSFLKLNAGEKRKKSGSVKLLTEDGRLIEVDSKLITRSGKKISDTEIHNWTNLSQKVKSWKKGTHPGENFYSQVC